MKWRIIIVLFLFSSCNTATARGRIDARADKRQASFSRYLHRNLRHYRPILDSAQSYRTRIYFTQINRDEAGKISFTDYYYTPGNTYYYPASCIKLPVIIAALQHITQFNQKQTNPLFKINLNDKLHIDTTNYCGFKNQSDVKNDWSFSNYIKRMLVVSNNYAFNPLYDYVVADSLPLLLNCHLAQRFNSACTADLNNIAFPYQVYDTLGNVKERKYSHLIHYNPEPLDSTWANAGLRYLNNQDQLINRPKSFANSNYVSLAVLHQLMKSIVQGDSLGIEPDMRLAVMKYMSIWPSECQQPSYDPKEYPDNWGKYLLFGGDTTFKTPSTIRVFNKVGQAYGFLTDCAYVVDYKNKVEFIVSASVFVDRDGTLNDGKYAYQQLGLPFLKDLGQVLLTHERKHKKKRKFAPVHLNYTNL